MKKPTPCEECRNQKRLCTYGNPCKRCLKFKLACTYAHILTPFDEEYIQKLQLLEQVELLQAQLCTMEHEMAALQLTAADSMNSPPLSAIPFKTRSITQQSTSSTTNTEKNSWSMTACKGNLVIRTDIKTHTELMAYLLKVAHVNHSIPWSLGDFDSSSSSNDISRNLLQKYMWKRYRYSRYKRITLQQHSTADESKEIDLIQKDLVSMMTWKLVQAYLYCRHLQHLTLHVPTFLSLLVRPDVMQSPAVLALCAIACVTPCRHMSHLLPPSNTLCEFYFTQARALIMESFDDTHNLLETYATLVLLAFYQLLTDNMESSRYYAAIAERVGVLLTEQSVLMDKEEGSRVLFQRLKLQLIKIISPGHMTKYRHFGIATTTVDPPFQHDYHTKAQLLQPISTDSERETRHLLLSIYITQLHKNVHQVVHHGPTLVDDYLGILGHQIELALRQWYIGLPRSFRLDTAILDVFFAKSDLTNSWHEAMTRTTDAIPLLTTMTLCSEYLMMAKTHVCETPEDLAARQDVVEYWRLSRGRINRNDVLKWYGSRWWEELERVTGFMEQQHIALNDDNNVTVMTKLLESGYSGFDHVIAQTSVRIALFAVELLQYLAKYYPCQYDQRVTLNAWDILIRASRFGFGDRNVLQAHLLGCLRLVYADCRTLIGSAMLVDRMEQEYSQCFSIRPGLN